MIIYNTPSTVAFHYRQQFHAMQKQDDDTTLDWFKRLQHSVEKCEFDHMLSDYMLIDKFVSGLNDYDFEKISKVPTWTTDELVLVVIGNAHIFINPQPNIDCIEIEIKNEEENIVSNEDNYQNDTDHESDENAHHNEFVNGENMGENALLIENAENNPKKIAVDKTVKQKRNKKHIDMLKRTGRYEDYKRKKAESAKNQRMRRKQNEQCLPPELQLHLINERRRAIRERVQRWRDRKSQNSLNTNEPDENIQTEMVIFDEEEILYSEERKNDGINESIDECSLLTPITFERCGPSKLAEISSVQTKRKSKYQKRNKEFECYLCLLKCKEMYELRAHLNVYHPVEKQKVFNCPQCTKYTTSREVLSKHLKKYHAAIKIHKCPCCDETFTKRGLLRSHLAVHPNYRPYICETCGNGFKTINELNSHHRKHTGIKQIKCDICDMFFASKSSYRLHLLTHTGEKPHRCEICHKDFRQRSSLRKHLISIHNQGLKPHLCQTCQKRFTSIYHLRIHNNVHTGARPYKCSSCDKTFSQPSALRAHTQRMHEKRTLLSGQKVVLSK